MNNYMYFFKYNIKYNGIICLKNLGKNLKLIIY